MSPTKHLFSILATGSALLLAVASASTTKRGICYNEDVPIGGFSGTYDGFGSQVNWQYNWDSSTVLKQPWAEFVPMLWGLSADHTGQWFDNAWFWINEMGSTHVLGFNEPELFGQASISPNDAAAAYPVHMSQFVGRAAIGSPAVSNDGHEWMLEFLAACSGCVIDFVAIHYYNTYFDGVEADFENFVNSMCALANGRPVWVTEFALRGTDDQAAVFMRSALPFLDNNPCVERYAYFGSADPDRRLLVSGGSSLSSLGIRYTYTPFNTWWE